MSSITNRTTAVTALAAALMAGGLSAAQPASAAARPANDLFNRAENLTAQRCEASAEGTNVGATGQARERPIVSPGHAGRVQSVWFKWKSPVSDTVVIDTEGSDFDTLVGVYTGNSLPGRLVAQNDDVAGDITSEVSFEARRNVTYKIAIDGFQASTGDSVLNITC